MSSLLNGRRLCCATAGDRRWCRSYVTVTGTTGGSYTVTAKSGEGGYWQSRTSRVDLKDPILTRLRSQIDAAPPRHGYD